MLKTLFCRAAPPARARLFRLAAPWACAWLVWLPSAHAAGENLAAKTVQAAPVVPFDRYQSWRDEPVADWRKANDRTGEIGGWRTYLRESQGTGGAGQADDGRHKH